MSDTTQNPITENMPDNTQVSKVIPLHSHVSHFWVACAPYFETTLLIAGSNPDSTTPLDPSQLNPAPQQNALGAVAELKLFDPDGYCFNELHVEYPIGEVGVIELEPLMAGCKYESGLKHGHVEIHSQQPITTLCRIHSHEGACFAREAAILSTTRKVFVPTTFSKDRSTILALLNRGDEPASVRGRLFLGNRSPEANWDIPAKGIRLVNLDTEFHDYIQGEGGEFKQGYVRVSVRGDFSVAAQLVECVRGPHEGNLFSVLS